MSLGIVALIPFTKLFHMVGGPAAFYLRQAAKDTGWAASSQEGEEVLKT